MKKYVYSLKGTVIKTGNSYAIRVPIEYFHWNKLKLGQKVRLESTPVLREGVAYRPEAFWQTVADLQELRESAG